MSKAKWSGRFRLAASLLVTAATFLELAEAVESIPTECGCAVCRAEARGRSKGRAS